MPPHAPLTTPPLRIFSVADAMLQPEDLPQVQRLVALRHRWDGDFPGRGGQARYSLSLPPTDATAQMALLIERVGNQAVVRLNGTVVQEFGTPGDPYFDAAKVAQLIVLPAQLLLADRPNRLTIDVTVQAMRIAGLSQVEFGPLPLLEARQARLRLLDQSTAIAYAACLLLMGGLAAGLWWRQRDPMYGCFSLLAWFGVLRQLDHVGQVTLLPWPVWGIALTISYGLHLGLIARFIVMLVEAAPRWVAGAVNGVLVAVPVLALLAFGLRIPDLWTLALALLELLGVVALAVVARDAFTHRKALVWVVAGVATLLVLAGLHDILLVRLGLWGGSNVGLTPHAMFLLILVLAGVVVERYSRSVADYRALNEHLAERVAKRESQLRHAFETLRIEQQDRAVLNERQRIMRDIHDGIGSQLVGMLNMIGQQTPDPAALESEIRLALDEMRIAVDSLQPMDSDLTTVLATLRYRLQPRLHAAGLDVVWDVAAIPPLADLSPPSILQIQRILLEAFTNVLKHAGATQVRLQAQWLDGPEPHVVLRVTDNGRGPAVGGAGGVSQGRGLSNMNARATAIGATLRIEPAPQGGTSVVVDWPVKRREPDALDTLQDGAIGDSRL